MKVLDRRALAALPVLLLAVAPAALAAPVGVDIRVEGRNTTIFEDEVTTDGHAITMDGAAHNCDGTNGGANPARVPVATAALDDAARLGSFSWDATWFDSFGDFLIDRVGPDPSTSSEFWNVFVNGVASQVGGCQERVRQGNEVLWAFDAYNKDRALRLAGPDAATVGKPISVKVTDVKDGSPQSGAAVLGSRTGADGTASLTFSQPGVFRLKAEKARSVRSNKLIVCADPAGAEPCTSSDGVPPLVKMLLRSGYASTSFKSRTFTLAWQAQDSRGGSGVRRYLAETRVEGDATATASAVGDWTTLARTTVPTARFRAEPGRTYGVRVTAFDRAGNPSPASRRRLVVPVDDRDRKLLRFSKGWKRLERKAAWGRFVRRSSHKGATVRMRFNGAQATVIGRKLPKGGKVLVEIGGWKRTFLLRGKGGYRKVILRTPRFGSKPRTLKITTLGGGPVEIDAVAPLP